MLGHISSSKSIKNLLNRKIAYDLLLSNYDDTLQKEKKKENISMS